MNQTYRIVLAADFHGYVGISARRYNQNTFLAATMTTSNNEDKSAYFYSDAPGFVIANKMPGNIVVTVAGENHLHGSTSYLKIATLSDILASGSDILQSGKFWFGNDMIADGNLIISTGTDVQLCFNGHTLDLNGHHIVNYGTLSLVDCSDTVRYFVYTPGGEWLATTTDANAIDVAEISGETTEGTIIRVKGGIVTGGKASVEGGKAYGGALENKGTVTIKNVSILGNEADGGTVSLGGGVYNDGIFTMEGGTIAGNYAGDKGGGLYTENDDCTFGGYIIVQGNKAGDEKDDNNVQLDDGHTLSVSKKVPLYNGPVNLHK